MDKQSLDRIEKKVELKATVDRVWRALTDHTEFSQWFRLNLDGPFIPGHTTRGHVTFPGYEHLKVEIMVEKMEAKKFFSYRWHPYPADPNVDYSLEPTTLVEFRLKPDGDGTLLEITESGFDALPASRRDEAFRMNDGGWTSQIKNIENYVCDNF